MAFDLERVLRVMCADEESSNVANTVNTPEDQAWYEEIDNLIEKGYLQSDLEPIKCPKCEGIDFIETNKSFDGGHLSEFTVVCSQCDSNLGHWAYGGWQL